MLRPNQKTFTVALGCFFLTAATIARAQGVAEETVSVREAEVYTELLNRLARTRPQGQDIHLVVASQTIPIEAGYRVVGAPASLAEDIAWRVPAASREIVAELLRANKRVASIKLRPSMLHPAMRAQIVRDIEIREIVATADIDAWRRFGTTHDGAGYAVQFSRIGFGRDQNTALVYTELNCPGLCGAGELILLRRTSGVWRVLKQHPLWAS